MFIEVGNICREILLPPCGGFFYWIPGSAFAAPE